MAHFLGSEPLERASGPETRGPPGKTLHHEDSPHLPPLEFFMCLYNRNGHILILQFTGPEPFGESIQKTVPVPEGDING